MLLSLADGLLFLALAAAPLLYGSVNLFALLFLAFLSTLLFNAVYFARPWALSAAFGSPWTWLGLGLLPCIGIQLFPWPAELVQNISPAVYQFYEIYLPGGLQAGKPLTFSVYPSGTLRGFIQFLTYGLFFLSVLMRLVPDPAKGAEVHFVSLRRSEYLKLGCLTGVLSLLFHSLYDFNLHIPSNGIYFGVLLALGAGARDKAYDHAFFRRMVDFVVAFGFLIALFAIFQKFSSDHHIYWRGSKAGNSFGSFYNYDHYAGFMELCSAVTIGRIVASIFHTSFFHCKGLIKKIAWFSTQEANQTLWQLLMFGVMAATIFMSTSRGGIMSFALSQILFFAIVSYSAWRNRKGTRLAGILAVAFLLVGVMVIWLGPGPLLERMHMTSLDKILKMEGPDADRLRFYKGALEVIQDFPAVGTGLNTFGTNFTRYRTFTFRGGVDYLRYTHNDYLQLVSETGVSGVLFLLGFLILYLAALVRVARRLE